MYHSTIEDSERNEFSYKLPVQKITIVSEPIDVTTELGSYVNLSAKIIASNPYFQWYNVYGQQIPNKNHSNIFIGPLKQEDFGFYRLEVINTLTGEKALTRWVEIKIQVRAKPRILQEICCICLSEKTALLSAYFENASSYQWYKDGRRLTGCTGNNLEIHNTDWSTGVYVLGATNPYSGIMETTSGYEFVANILC